MLIDAPQTDTPLVTVIPDDADTEADAIRVTASLRRSGIVADLAFRGNAKRRFELAAKSGSIGRVVLRRSGPSGLPDRVGIHLRVNQPASHDRENDLRPIILAALERDYQVRRFEAVEGASWSPDAVLQEKPGA
jgi:histidyl-tRNA synthetase